MWVDAAAVAKLHTTLCSEHLVAAHCYPQTSVTTLTLVALAMKLSHESAVVELLVLIAAINK
jgi:hypothetical protein